MDTLKRRKMNNGLEQPLLEKPDAVASSSSHQEDDLRQRLIPRSTPSKLSSFLASVVACLRHVFDTIYECFIWLFPGLAIPPQLTPMQVERLGRLLERSAEPFKPDDPQHQALLRQLWSHAFPNMAFTTPKTPQWKEMGWQGEDPATDFRGAGRLGLDCLLYLATEHSLTFSRLLGKLDGERSDWEYPFAVAGLNISFMLLEVIGLQARGGASRGTTAAVCGTAAGRGFAGLVLSDESAFEELFVVSFECLDRLWLAQRASYMQFGQVMKALKGKVEAALSQRPKSLAALRHKLLAE